MLSVILFLPLVGAVIAGLFGNRIGARASEIITSTFMGVAALLSAVVLYEIGFSGHGHDEATKVVLATWLDSGTLEVDWAIRLDSLTAVMLVVVNGVSALVHVYSIGYMHEDPHRSRFFAYLSLFTFAMLMLVTADNFVQMFFGWEGVGLASYLLIGFWYDKPSANAAAIKAFVVNRVGDFGFLLGIFGIFFAFGSLDFDFVFAQAPDMAGQTFSFLGMQVDVLTTISLLLFLGAMGKSAQFLLHTWLPDAMEGPTPVSALIHAATMVTAGVFLVCRISPILEFAPTALMLITIVGGVTAFFAATIGLVQNDIKRVVAYSTCSQLGYMFFAAGVGAYQAAMFHLFTHAFFKALLFLGSGAVIHAMHHEQDMRRMGALYNVLPVTYLLMLVGTLALTGVGIPGTAVGFAGFFSKDATLETAFAAQTDVGAFAFWLGLAAAALTSLYSWRLVFMTFHGRSRAAPETLSHAHEAPLVMLLPLIVLAVGAILAGVVFYDPFVGHHQAEFWGRAIFVQDGGALLEASHHVPKWVKWTPLVATGVGFALAFFFYILQPDLPGRIAARRGPLYVFLEHKWFFDELYDRIFVRPALWLGGVLWKGGDERTIDGLGPNGVAARVVDVTRQLVRLQSGFVYHYAFAMLIGIAILITWFTVTGGR
ncbi:MAG: NADH-quinone oxidoreductase subunit L [Alphaproteobacteria bacterium]